MLLICIKPNGTSNWYRVIGFVTAQCEVLNASCTNIADLQRSTLTALIWTVQGKYFAGKVKLLSA